MKFIPQQIQSVSPAVDMTSHKQSSTTSQPSIPSANISINRIILDGFSHFSAASFRVGFSDAWKDADTHHWSADTVKTFSSEIQLEPLKANAGHELGKQLALALIKQAHPQQESA